LFSAGEANCNAREEATRIVPSIRVQRGSQKIKTMSRNIEKRLARLEKALFERSGGKCNCADPDAMFQPRWGVPHAHKAELDLTCPVHPVRRISKWLELVLVFVDKDGNRKERRMLIASPGLGEEYERRRLAQFEAALKGAYDKI
jgi:hypothetical protein